MVDNRAERAALAEALLEVEEAIRAAERQGDARAAAALKAKATALEWAARQLLASGAGWLALASS